MKTESLVDQALSFVKRDEDGAVSEKDLVEAVAQLITVDEKSVRQKQAKSLVKRRSKPGNVKADGQLRLPFNDDGPYAYEPDRLVNSDGLLIEQRKALVKHKIAEATAASNNLRRVQIWERRKSTEARGHAIWTLEQMQSGRPGTELIFDNHVRETGLWQPGEAPREEPTDGDE